MVIGICLCCGKGGILVAGYNFKAKNEKARKYEKRLLRAVGIVILLFTICFAAMFAGVFSDVKAVSVTFGVLSGVVLICGLIIINCSPKLKEALFLAQKLSENPYYEQNDSESKDDAK